MKLTWEKIRKFVTLLVRVLRLLSALRNCPGPDEMPSVPDHADQTDQTDHTSSSSSSCG